MFKELDLLSTHGSAPGIFLVSSYILMSMKRKV